MSDKKQPNAFHQFRDAYVNEVRLPLMRNIVRQCLKAFDPNEYKDYDLIVDLERNTVKLMFNPSYGEDCAWLLLAGSIEEEPQMHDEMAYYDMNYYNFHRMTPIAGRYHRFEDPMGNEQLETLTTRELRDPLLIELINNAFKNGFYFETIDAITGRKEKVFEFTATANHEANNNIEVDEEER